MKKPTKTIIAVLVAILMHGSITALAVDLPFVPADNSETESSVSQPESDTSSESSEDKRTDNKEDPDETRSDSDINESKQSSGTTDQADSNEMPVIAPDGEDVPADPEKQGSEDKESSESEDTEKSKSEDPEKAESENSEKSKSEDPEKSESEDPGKAESVEKGTSKSEDDKKESSLAPIIIGVVIGVVLIGTGTFIVVKNKKK